MEIGNPNTAKRMKNKYFLFYCSHPFKKYGSIFGICTATQPMGAPTYPLPIRAASKQTHLPLGDIMYSCAAVIEDCLSKCLALFYTSGARSLSCPSYENSSRSVKNDEISCT
jgi:hypothetical protein